MIFFGSIHTMTHGTGFRIWITVGRVGLHIIDNFLFDNVTHLVVVQRLSHLWRLAMMEMCLMKIAAKTTQTLPSQSSHENRQLPSGGLRCASRVGVVPLQWTRTEKRLMQRCGTGKFQQDPFIRYNTTSISTRGAATLPTHLPIKEPTCHSIVAEELLMS